MGRTKRKKASAARRRPVPVAGRGPALQEKPFRPSLKRLDVWWS
jgi:hypothetical protein